MIFSSLFFVYIKVNCYQLNRDRLLNEVKDRYHNGGGK